MKNRPTSISRDALKAKFPRASQSFLELNSNDHSLAPFPHSAIEEPVARDPLVSPVPGEAAGSRRDRVRVKIRITVRAIRPCDWDNYHIKELQDVLVHAGILAGDEWDLLSGEVISEKVDSQEEEGTLIEVIEQSPSSGCGDGEANPFLPQAQGLDGIGARINPSGSGG